MQGGPSLFPLTNEGMDGVRLTGRGVLLTDLKPGIGGGPRGNPGRPGGNSGGGSLGDLYFGGLLCACRL